VKEKNMYDYTDHSEIPGPIRSYIMTVADADNISEIPLQEINGFLNGLDEYERGVAER
tara:strand:+ start:138 stop:311 length:174 start_codon:yes stop_codon:yes gene_type:complete